MSVARKSSVGDALALVVDPTHVRAQRLELLRAGVVRDRAALPLARGVQVSEELPGPRLELRAACAERGEFCGDLVGCHR